jgi:hypothetical protein
MRIDLPVLRLQPFFRARGWLRFCFAKSLFAVDAQGVGRVFASQNRCSPWTRKGL